MIQQQNDQTYFEFIKPVSSSISVLEKSLEKIDTGFSIQRQANNLNSSVVSKIADEQLNEQMNFIYKISGDIGKITNLITA
jgi:archaellum component FlaC